jgi:hypothetical protein
MSALRERMSTVGGGLLMAVLAGLFAMAVNLGILRAAGDPTGPGRLGDSAPRAQVQGGGPPASTSVAPLSIGGSAVPEDD